MVASTNAAAPTTAPSGGYRWMQLTVGVICMAMMANLQYGWTFFVGPMAKAHSWDVASIQVAFSLFIAFETWLTPVQGFIVDYLGPRGPKWMVAIGGVLAALGWLINAWANSLEMLYVGAVISGAGAGGVYATCVGNAVKWFPDRRGLAVGITAAGFGAGAVVTVIPIQMMIASIGYSDTFFWFALVQGGIVFVLAWLLRPPLAGEVPSATAVKVLQTKTSSNPAQVLRSPIFWILYVMFIMVSASGLMVAAQVAVIAKDYGVSETVILFGASTLTVAAIIDGLCNGGARPFFGWVSDQIGREYTMAIAFTLASRRLLAAWNGRLDAVGIRDQRRDRLLHVGRDLQPVPLDHDRHIRTEIRHDQHRPHVYGEGNVGFCGPAGEPAEGTHAAAGTRCLRSQQS